MRFWPLYEAAARLKRAGACSITVSGLGGYRQLHQEGSHVILETEEPSHHRISVPAHKTLRVGRLSGIVRAVSRHKGVPRDEVLRPLS